MASRRGCIAAGSVALPAGLVGIFLAGVPATAITDFDSHTLVAGADVAYAPRRSPLAADAFDPELVRATKRGIAISWLVGLAIEFVFSRIVALLVFMTTPITSMALVPGLIGRYGKGGEVAARNEPQARSGIEGEPGGRIRSCVSCRR